MVREMVVSRLVIPIKPRGMNLFSTRDAPDLNECVRSFRSDLEPGRRLAVAGRDLGFERDVIRRTELYDDIVVRSLDLR